MGARGLIPYAQLEVAGDETLEADLRGMFARSPGECWFRPITIETSVLRRSAVAPEAYLLGEGGAEHYREAHALADVYRAGGHLPPVIVYLPERRATRETPEVLDGYHRLSAAVAAGVTELDALLLVDAGGDPLRPALGTTRRPPTSAGG